MSVIYGNYSDMVTGGPLVQRELDAALAESQRTGKGGQLRKLLNAPDEFGGPGIPMGNGLTGYGMTPGTSYKHKVKSALMSGDFATVDQLLQSGPTTGGGQMAHYFQLGQQMLRQQAQLQQQMGQQQGSGMAGSSMDNSFDVSSNPMLTAGFDPSWLSQRLAAGSANGASIQSGGGGGVGKPTPTSSNNLPAGGVEAGWDTPTIPSYGGMKGAGRLF